MSRQTKTTKPLKVERVAIASLSPDPENARRHGERNLDAIRSSLQRFGQQKPIVVSKDGTVVAGNGTLEAAKALGWKDIAVVRTGLDTDAAAAFAVADNRAASPIRKRHRPDQAVKCPAMLRNVKLVIAYDGADFHGWQNQPDQRTVQDCLEQAVRRVVRHQVVVVGAGRTDARVHAAGQVANFFTTSPVKTDSLARAIGSRLPKDMTLIDAADVPLTFHSTHSAVSKLYRYRIHNAPGRPCERQQQRFVYHFWQPLHIDRLRAAAAQWVGEHDFTAFASSGNVRATNVRTVLRIEVYRVGWEIRIDVEGTGFLYNQVRNFVGTLLEIGRGHWPVERAKAILDGRDRSQAGPTAPARGLCLQWVRYDIPGLPEPDEKMLERARAARSPRGAERAEVDGKIRSTAPLPPDYDMTEEPPA